MKRLYSAAALAALLLAACADTIQTPVAPDEALFARGGRELSYATIQVPGTVETTAMGINAGGDIVGFYTDATGVHGFLLRRGEFTAIDFPGASLTQARAIGPSGEIVGTYKLPGDPGLRWRSFIRSPKGEFRDIAVPGHQSIMAQRILPDGTIVGCVHGANFMSSMKGFTMGPHGTQVYDIFASMHNGATPDLGRIVGLYFDMEAGHRKAYIIDDGVFTSFQFPGGRRTEAWDVNPAGDVVGMYVLFENNLPVGTRGFLLTRDGPTTIHFTGATQTIAYGINPAGDIVGAYLLGGTWHGYVASRTGRPTR